MPRLARSGPRPVDGLPPGPCTRGSYVAMPRGSDGLTDATVVVTTAGGSLFEIARSFLDDRWAVYAVDGSDGCYGLPALEHAVENVEARWVVLLDEDAFVLDNERLRMLTRWAAHCGHAAVGVPDGGVISHRTHNPNALNLFFNVLDLESIRAIWSPGAWRRWIGRGSEVTRLGPPASLLKPDVPYRFDDYEPYYCFYLWLADSGLSLGYLDARDHTDGISTVVLDHEARPVVVHSWYGREFDAPGPMRERILDVIDFARGGQDRGARWRGRAW